MRKIEYLAEYKIAGRGSVFEVRQIDPPYKVNEHILVDDREAIITGIDSYCVWWGQDYGMPIGLLVRFEKK